MTTVRDFLEIQFENIDGLCVHMGPRHKRLAVLDKSHNDIQFIVPPKGPFGPLPGLPDVKRHSLSHCCSNCSHCHREDAIPAHPSPVPAATPTALPCLAATPFPAALPLAKWEQD